ncbi:MAG: SDR family NAD(P)-dependent oxidoreductase [Pseudomonadota bacterium]
MSFAWMGENLNAAVIGATGGIGAALTQLLVRDPAIARVYGLARDPARLTGRNVIPEAINLVDTKTIAHASQRIKDNLGQEFLDIVIIASGILHDQGSLQPEKTWRDLRIKNLHQVFHLNAFAPVLIAKYFLPLLPRKRRAIFAALSARVGSIGDNKAGGWYAYRASKAALNMFIRTLAIEMTRRNPQAIIVGLHPGTVATDLSGPFSARAAKVFTPDQSASYLLQVLHKATPNQTGSVLAWDGQTIIP